MARPLASLRARLLALVAVALAPAFVLIAWNHHQDLLGRQADLNQAARRIAHSRAYEFGEKIEDTKGLLAIVAGFPTVKSDPSTARCGEILADMKRALPIYVNLGVVLPDGNLACSAESFDRKQPPNFADREWFRRALAAGGFSVGGYVVGRLTGKHIFLFAQPVIDENGRGTSLAYASLDLAWLSRHVANIPLPADAALLVLDNQGRILARHPDHDEWVGKPHPQAASYLAASAAMEEGLFEAPGADSVVRSGAFSRVPGSDGQLTVYFGLTSDHALRATRHEFILSMVVMAAILLASFALAWFAAETLLLRRTRRLSETAARLAAGETAARSGIAGSDEIGRLAAAFDAMAEAVAEREARLARAIRALRVIYASNRELLRSQDDRGLLEAVCRLIVEKGGFAAAWVGRKCEDEDKRVEPVAAFGVSNALAQEINAVTWGEGPSGLGPVGTAIREHRNVVVKDIASETVLAQRRAAAAREGFASAAALPLMVGSEVWGALGIFARERDAFSDEEIRLLSEAASDLAFGLTTLRLRAREAAAQEASRLKSEFLASMSHELRTPLNAIIGFSEILRDGMAGDVTEQQREYLQDILSSGTHLLALINDILDLSKVEAGKMSLELERLTVDSLLKASLAIVRERAVSHRQTLDLQVAADAGELCADTRKVKQIVYNLLSNAVKFTPDGGRIVLSARRVPADAAPAQARPPAGTTAFLEIAVSDTGIGISAADQDRLFSAFTQIDSSLARNYEGTGLGLALVRRLAELHGGAVGVESAPGQGSTFRVWLPCRPVPECLIAQHGAGEPARQPSGDRVLVVEDESRAFELLRLALERDGFKVARAADAQEARARLEAETPDLITLDILLPGEDGWQFLDWLKHSVDYAHIPVVVISIVAEEEKGFALGASAVLEKPFMKDDLTRALIALGFAEPARGPARVLVIDDEPVAVEHAARLLEAEGHTVERAFGGREGVAKALAAPPDLVILDLLMPDLSGFDVVTVLRTDARTAIIPIVVVTGKMLDEADRRELNGHVQAVIAKSGFSPALFMAEVHRALRVRRGA